MSIKRLLPKHTLDKRWARWRKLPIASRPFLHEGVRSGGFNFGAFTAFVGFFLVIGLWLSSPPADVRILKTSADGLEAYRSIWYQLPALVIDQAPATAKKVKLRISYYWPALGGINCDQVDGVDECIYTAAGLDHRAYIGQIVACPAEWAFGTQVWIKGTRWVCQDRGGMIVGMDGVYWVDLLYPYLPWGDVVYGDVITGYIQ